MRDVLESHDRFAASGRRVALATVVRAQGSAPRPVGATMVVAGDGEMAGSVSGGCVENDVVLHAIEALDTGEGRLVTYGIADDEAFAVGLACGGTIEVLIRPAPGPEVRSAAARLVAAERSGAVATVASGPDAGAVAVLDASGDTLAGGLPDEVAADVAADVPALVDIERSRMLRYGEREVLVETIVPEPQLVVFGAVHIAQPLCAMARIAGFRVTVTDPRPAFATPERFPEASRVLPGQPADVVAGLDLDRRTYAVVLNHDARHEDPVLVALLRSEARYIGAMGSRRTHALRLDRMREAGFGEADLERIHGPIGLDIGAVAPAEIAVAILAEMIRARRGFGSGVSLRGTSGPIHRERRP
jgi:xanthine dehydrogenase accessory factor